MLEYFIQVSYFEDNALLYDALFLKKKTKVSTSKQNYCTCSTRFISNKKHYRNIQFLWRITKVECTQISVHNDLPTVCLAFKEILNRKPHHFSKKYTKKIVSTLHKKWSFPLRISSVNVTKSTVSSGFGHIYWRHVTEGTFRTQANV